MKKVLGVIMAIFVIALSFPLKSHGAEFQGSSSGTTTVEQGAKVKNLYVAGSNVAVNADVNKDLVAAGSNIEVNGNVESDFFAAGADVVTKGNIGGSARIAGNKVTINSIISEDLLVVGSIVNINDQALVSGDLLLMGNTVNQNGKISGDFKATGGDITIGGTIDGNVSIKNAQKVTIKKTAVLNGKFEYSSPSEATVEDGAQIKGSIDYSKVESGKSISNRTFWQGLVIKLFSSLLLLIILVYLFPKFSKRVVESAYSSFFPNMSYGLLALIITPIIALMLLFLVLTGALAAMTGLLYVLFLITASAFTGLLIGTLVLKSVEKSAEYKIDWLSAIVGVILVSGLSFVKFVGPVIIFVFFLTALGTLVVMTWKTIKESR